MNPQNLDHRKLKRLKLKSGMVYDYIRMTINWPFDKDPKLVNFLYVLVTGSGGYAFGAKSDGN